MADFYLKKGDTRSKLTAYLKDDAGAAVDLTGATVKFSMRNGKTGAVKVNEAGCTVLDAAAGRVQYTWAAGDVDTAGVFSGEFEVTFSDGGIQTFPNAADLTIWIREQVA